MKDDVKDFWIQTFSGKKFYPLAPEDNEYCIEDIAHALSNICRFVGHSDRFYSVGQHCIVMSTILPPDLALAGLLHDASEAYITDVARPIKYIPDLEGYRKIEHRIQNAIFSTFDVKNGDHPDIKWMDSLLLRNEAKCLKLLTPEWKIYTLPDLGLDINPMSPPDTEALFLKRWERMKQQHKPI